MDIILTLKVTMNQVNTKKLCLGYFYRFVSHALTLRLRNTYAYVCQALFGFCNFYATSCGFWKIGVSSLHSTLNFEQIERDFWRLYVLACCCASNQYSEITGMFFEISNQRAVRRVNFRIVSLYFYS